MRTKSIVSTALVTALALAPLSAAWAQGDVSGRLKHIEPGSRTLYFQDGRIVTLEPGATLWVDGRELPIETLRSGMNVVVRDGGTSGQPSAQASPSPTAVKGHPRVTASGTVAKVDADQGLVTFQDGRTLKLGHGSQVWEESNLNDIQPGEQVLLRDAQPATYAGMTNVPAERMRMGRVVEMDHTRSMVRLDDGHWVRISPTTRMRMNGREAQVQLQPGDELIVVIGEVQPTPQAPRAQAGASEGQRQAGEAPSAMPREGLVERGDPVQADEVHIFRRRQSP